MNYMERLQRKEENAATKTDVLSMDDEAEGYGSTGWSRSRRSERQGTSLDLDRGPLLAASQDLASGGRSRSGSIDEVSRRRSDAIETSLPPAVEGRLAQSTALAAGATKTVIVEVRYCHEMSEGR